MLRGEEGTTIATTTSRGAKRTPAKRGEPPRTPDTGSNRRTRARPAASDTHKGDGSRDADDQAGSPEQGVPGGEDRFRIRLFDATKADHHLAFAEALTTKVTDNHLLWIDIAGTPSPVELEAIGDAFALDDAARRSLSATEPRPRHLLRGNELRLRVAAEPDDHAPEQVRWLDIIAGGNLVITRHEDPLAFIAGMDERIERDTVLGKIDAPQFVASLLESIVTSYFAAIDALEDDADKLDSVALRDEGRRALLADLVGVRRRVARLRRLLADHRDVFASLAAVDIAAVKGGEDAAPAMRAVATRFEGVMSAVDDAREAILGSFDIYMTRTAQRTNDIMKVLAIATVLLLPGSVIAGLLGMNVQVPLDKDSPLSFWLVLAGVGSLAVAVLLFARRRGWM